MSIVSARVVPYQRTLIRPIVTSHGVYRTREGFLLVAQDDEGCTAVGDAAPLPGLSLESAVDCEWTLRMLAGERIPRELYIGNPQMGVHMALAAFFDQRAVLMKDRRCVLDQLGEEGELVPQLRVSTSPSAVFAASTVIGVFKAMRKCKSLANALRENAAMRVPVNGLITENHIEGIERQAKLLDAQGYSSFKIKVGLDHASDDAARIQAVYDAAPHARLRLDANGGWDEEWADNVLSNIPLSHVDFIEQPFPRGQWEASRLLAEKYHVRLALDEDVHTIDEAKELIQRRACDVLVLKPMVLGRLYQCVLLAEEAREAEIEVIYTSSWESDIGLAATLHLAAALGPNPPAMGLSTAGMISEGIVTNPLKIENGFLKVPEGPGLGMELAPEILAQLK